MPDKIYANNRKLTKIGDSYGVTFPRGWLEDRGLLDENGDVREVECEAVETDDGAMRFEIVGD